MKFCSDTTAQEKRRRWILEDKEYRETSVFHDTYTDMGIVIWHRELT